MMTFDEPSGHWEHIRVGTSIIVVRDRRVLVGRRKGSHAAGLISFPGGHLEFRESFAECLFRELEEECGHNLKISLVPFDEHNLQWFVTNDIMLASKDRTLKYDKHYITIFMVAKWENGDAVNTEPNKCEGWEWITFDELKKRGDEAAQWIPIHLIEFHRERMGI